MGPKTVKMRVFTSISGERVGSKDWEWSCVRSYPCGSIAMKERSLTVASDYGPMVDTFTFFLPLKTDIYRERVYVNYDRVIFRKI